MTATICGHDREILQYALGMAIRSPWCISEMRDPPTDWQNDSHYVAMMALSDPAKLAAILADLIRGRGIEPKRCRAGQHAHDGKIHIVVYFGDDAKGGLFDMSRARRLALALLDAPNATAQDVERMIGEVTL